VLEEKSLNPVISQSRNYFSMYDLIVIGSGAGRREGCGSSWPISAKQERRSDRARACPRRRLCQHRHHSVQDPARVGPAPLRLQPGAAFRDTVDLTIKGRGVTGNDLRLHVPEGRRRRARSGGAIDEKPAPAFASTATPAPARFPLRQPRSKSQNAPRHGSGLKENIILIATGSSPYSPVARAVR